MKTHNFDYAYIALSASRIGGQLKKGISLNITCGFNTDKAGDYCYLSIYQEEDRKCLNRLYLNDYTNVYDLIDSLFNYCMENDLFKVPMDIKLVD
jgi:hypothetical protein